MENPMEFIIELVYWTTLLLLAIFGTSALIASALLFLEYIFEKGKRK